MNITLIFPPCPACNGPMGHHCCTKCNTSFDACNVCLNVAGLAACCRQQARKVAEMCELKRLLKEVNDERDIDARLAEIKEGKND